MDSTDKKSNPKHKKHTSEPLLKKLRSLGTGEEMPMKESDFKRLMEEAYRSSLIKTYYDNNKNLESVLSELTLNAYETKALAKLISSKDAGECKKHSAKEIRTKYEKFSKLSEDDIATIINKSLYLALPKKEIKVLLDVIGLPDHNEKSMLGNIGLEDSSSLSVEDKDISMDLSLAYFILNNNDTKAKENFSQILEKCKRVFDNNIQFLEEYIDKYQVAESTSTEHRAQLNYSSTIVTDAFNDIKLAEYQTLSPEWAKLLVNDTTKIIGKLSIDAQLIMDSWKYSSPKPLTKPDDALQTRAKIKFPEVFNRIQELDLTELNKRNFTKEKIERFIFDYYKASLNSKEEVTEENEALLKEALLKSIDHILKIKTQDNMPDITLKYSELTQKFFNDFFKGHNFLPASSKKDYYMEKLPFNDLRGFYLGKLTNCCQSMDGHGHEAVSYGMTQPNSAFYVIYEKNPPKKDRIVAQSWAWLGTNGESIVFDSFERLGKEHNKLCRIFMKAAADYLKSTGKFDYIGLGCGGNTPYHVLLQCPSPVRMYETEDYEFNYDGLLYTDSKRQYDASEAFCAYEKLWLLYKNNLKNEDIFKNFFQKLKSQDLINAITFSIDNREDDFLQEILSSINKFNNISQPNFNLDSHSINSIISFGIDAGNIAILNDTFDNASFRKCILDRDTILKVIEFNNIDILSKISEHPSYSLYFNNRIKKAIASGNVSIFNTIIQHPSCNKAQLNLEVVYAAIQSDNITFFSTIIKHPSYNTIELNLNIIHAAIQSRNTNILNKIAEHLSYNQVKIDSIILCAAIHSSNIDILNKIAEHPFYHNIELNLNVIYSAVTSGNIAILNKIANHPFYHEKITLPKEELEGLSEQRLQYIATAIKKLNTLFESSSLNEDYIFKIINSSEERLELFCKNKEKPSARLFFNFFIEENLKESLERLVIATKMVNETYGEKKETLLHRALSTQPINTEWLKELISSGADPQIKNKEDKTAEDLAETLFKDNKMSQELYDIILSASVIAEPSKSYKPSEASKASQASETSKPPSKPTP